MVHLALWRTDPLCRAVVAVLGCRLLPSADMDVFRQTQREAAIIEFYIGGLLKHTYLELNKETIFLQGLESMITVRITKVAQLLRPAAIL